MATFTSWAALYAVMLDNLANFVAGQSNVISYSISSGITTRQLTYRSFDELKKGLEYVKQMADIEGGTAVRRTYAKQGGGGRW